MVNGAADDDDADDADDSHDCFEYVHHGDADADDDDDDLLVTSRRFIPV